MRRCVLYIYERLKRNCDLFRHMGGVWERIIRSIRKILIALLGQQLVTDEMLQTLMAEVAGILNSRPLPPLSSDPKDLEPLIPNHLLLLRSNPSLPVVVCRRSLEIGDLVLIADENVHRGKWPLGKVVDDFRGKEGYFRSAKVQTSITVKLKMSHWARLHKASTLILFKVARVFFRGRNRLPLMWSAFKHNGRLLGLLLPFGS